MTREQRLRQIATAPRYNPRSAFGSSYQRETVEVRAAEAVVFNFEAGGAGAIDLAACNAERGTSVTDAAAVSEYVAAWGVATSNVIAHLRLTPPIQRPLGKRFMLAQQLSAHNIIVWIKSINDCYSHA
jgi:hypothetical protein